MGVVAVPTDFWRTELRVYGALLLVGTHDLTGETERDLIITGGLLALVWLRTVPWPRLLVGVTGVLASASLYVYLTHWQVYPHLEDRWPLGGLVASLVVGIAVWRLVERTPWSHLVRSALPRPRMSDRPVSTTRQESR